MREAINAANADASVTNISFKIPAAQAGTGGVFTINVGGATSSLGALPTITRSITLDGYTQTGASANTNPITTGSNAVLLIELNGTNAGAKADELNIAAGKTTVRGLVINRFSDDGIELSTAGGNFIEGCFIGTNAAGTAAQGNGDDGISIDDTSNNTIGGTAPAARNVISGNGIESFGGVRLGSGTVVQGNYIGTDAAGTLALPNSEGIYGSGVGGCVIGGTTAGAPNLISGNSSNGIFLEDLLGVSSSPPPPSTSSTSSGSRRKPMLSSQTTVEGNLIGTDKTGALDLGNTRNGIRINITGDLVIGGGRSEP